MAVFVVTYTYRPQPEALAQLRPQRYAFFADLNSRGLLLASGQLLDSELGDGLLLDAPERDTAVETLDGDPFVTAGLVTQRTISAWNPTVGAWVSR